MDKGKVFNPGDEVRYESVSVVSKTIIKNPAGNVTLFSFDAGEGLAEHSSPYEALVQILEGSAEISLAGVVNNLEAGQCILFPANVPHALKAVNKFKMMLTMIKG